MHHALSTVERRSSSFIMVVACIFVLFGKINNRKVVRC
jgi:hypothetical protein